MTFQVAGIWKLALILIDEQTKSIWAHSEGVAVGGPLKGTILKRHPCYQTTWEEWVRMHPETEVLIWPENKLHQDGRHGHGAKDYLGRPGIRAGRMYGLRAGQLDERLPENAMVLGVNDPAGVKAYPLREVHKNGGVVNDMLGKEPVVLWSPRLDSHLSAAYSRKLEGKSVLEFEILDGQLKDAKTGSIWNVEGKAIKGSLAGKTLEPLDFVFLKWHVWSSLHPQSEIYASDRWLTASRLETRSFTPILEALANSGYDARIEDQVVRALCPNLASEGVALRINDDPFLLYRFNDRIGVHEYCYAERHLLPVGRYVLKSDPEKKFKDAAQLEPLPDEEIAWSELLNDGKFRDVIRKAVAAGRDQERDRDFGCSGLFEGLKSRGYRLEKIQQLEGRRLVPQTENGFSVSINGDPFWVYRFEDSASAQAYSEKQGHCLSVGCFVFRSDPPNQYKFKEAKTINLPDEEVDWSRLLEDKAFRGALISLSR